VNLAPQLLGASEHGAVQRRAPSRLGREGDGRLERDRAAPAGKPDPSARLTEPDQLPVAARARRETLRASVQRLEQVCLAGTVRPDDEDEPCLQVEVERAVGADVPERDLRDDQLVRPAAFSRRA